MKKEQNALVLDKVVKKFGNIEAVNSISFEVKRGKITGIIGGNGAGKTTTISMILGILKPTSGKIIVLDHDIATKRHEILHRMNFESPYVDMPLRLSVRQNLKIYAKLYGVINATEKINELIEALELGEFAERPVATLSSGQKTRTNLAKALLNQPELLLLDEPTASLDPVTGAWVRQHLVEHCRKNDAAILLTSHNMLEVEKICDYLFVMQKGKIIDQGSTQQIKDKYQHDNLEDVFIDITTR